MFKIAFCAGHYINTPGKRCLKSLDPNETREWVLNDRVADHFARAALEYEDVEILRTDDSTGKNDIGIPSRTKKANDWGADLYIDMHHNAGINGGSGGGVVAFCYPNSTNGKKYRDAIYEAVIAAGGLKGNRSQPLQEKKFDSLSLTNMPAVLMEYGFMDSRTDVPVILDEAYSKLVAYATMDGVAKVAKLKKKAPVATQPAVTESEQLYRVRTSWDNASSQIGAYKSLENAKKACSVGYTVYDKDGKTVYSNKATSTTATPVTVDPARSFNKSVAGTYTVNATSLNLRSGASTDKQILETMANGKTFTCYGYYTGDWLLGVSASGKKGFCHKSYLKKK